MVTKLITLEVNSKERTACPRAGTLSVPHAGTLRVPVRPSTLTRGRKQYAH